jgi:hypothetical protein
MACSFVRMCSTRRRQGASREVTSPASARDGYHVYLW